VGASAAASGAIQSGNYASGSISHNKIADAAITSGNLASGAAGQFVVLWSEVGTSVAASGAILSGNIASGQIGFTHFASGVVDPFNQGIRSKYVHLEQKITGSTTMTNSTDLVQTLPVCASGVGVVFAGSLNIEFGGAVPNGLKLDWFQLW
jgi:hypothetical protein